MSVFQWKIAGPAGYGIAASGRMFARACMRAGFCVFGYTEYPSLIRGGHTTFQVALRDKPINAAPFFVQLLVALNKEEIEKHRSEMSPDGLILSEETCEGAVTVPFTAIAQQDGGKPLMRNTVALGASFAMMGLPFAPLEAVIRQEFLRKGDAITQENVAAAKRGYTFTQEKNQTVLPKLPRRNEQQKILLTGNEAIGLGAIAGGLGFYASYPMTPTSGILHYLAGKAEKHGMVVRHAEDEIGVINMTIGASYAGVRSMCGTAGGGFALMTEAFGLAGVAETPLVVVVGQRPGPATGMPTWTSQGDLRFVIHASQDEFPRVVLTPGDVDDCFFLTVEALNIAELFQVPVILLHDKMLGDSFYMTDFFDMNRVIVQQEPRTQDGKGIYVRYKDTESGVSPRAFPGDKGAVFLANSYEHDEHGYATEDAAMRVQMMRKRMKKLPHILARIPKPELYGKQDANHTLVCWGSTKGAALCAMELLEDVNVLFFPCVWPFPTKECEALMRSARSLILIEGNYEAQLGGIIRQHTGIDIEKKFLKYDGRPFWPDEIVTYVRSLS